MNKTQISKVLRYFFVEKKYGIKSFDTNAIWLLKLDEKYPIVCIAITQQSEQEYQQRWEEYKTLLQVDQPLLLINHELYETYDFVYKNIYEDTMVKTIMDSESYQSTSPDYLFSMLQKRFKYPKGIKRVVTWAIVLLSLVVFLINHTFFSIQTHYVFGGYFRYAILGLHDYSRLFTSLFNTNNLLLLLVYSFVLHKSEYTFTLQHSRLKFIGVIITTLLFVDTALLISNIEVIQSGLTGVIACLTLLSLSKFLLVWKLQPSPFKSLMTGVHFINVLLLIFMFGIDFYPTVYGCLFALLLLYYIKIKDDTQTLLHFKIACSILIVGMFIMLVQTMQNIEMQQDVKQQLQQHQVQYSATYYQNIFKER